MAKNPSIFTTKKLNPTFSCTSTTTRMPSQSCFIERCHDAYNGVVVNIPRPKLPEGVTIEGDYVGVYAMDNQSTYYFYKDGNIMKKVQGHTTYTWYTKLTLAEAIQHSLRPNIIGDSFQFNSDGSLEARWFGQNFYWPSGTPDEYVVQGTTWQGTTEPCTGCCCRDERNSEQYARSYYTDDERSYSSYAHGY